MSPRSCDAKSATQLRYVSPSAAAAVLLSIFKPKHKVFLRPCLSGKLASKLHIYGAGSAPKRAVNHADSHFPQPPTRRRCTYAKRRLAPTSRIAPWHPGHHIVTWHESQDKRGAVRMQAEVSSVALWDTHPCGPASNTWPPLTCNIDRVPNDTKSRPAYFKIRVEGRSVHPAR